MRIGGVSFGALLMAGLLWTGLSLAADVNVYSARKEALIKPLLDRFQAQTGIAVHLVTAEADPLLERLAREGANSPADLFLTVDVARLWRAAEAGLLQPVRSAELEQRVPAAYREPAGLWYGLSLRARPIFYVPEKVKPEELSTYAALADPKWKGRICVRSSNNVYNQSMVAAFIAAEGEAATETWARGLVAHLARPPKGGDRDQILAAAQGVCDVALANTYYYGQMLVDPDPAVREAAGRVRIFWPDQQGRGAHVNLSGAGVAKHAPHRDEALRLLEFLASDEAQRWYAEENLEYPVRESVPWGNAVSQWGRFRADGVSLAELGRLNPVAVKVMDRAGWK